MRYSKVNFHLFSIADDSDLKVFEPILKQSDDDLVGWIAKQREVVIDVTSGSN